MTDQELDTFLRKVLPRERSNPNHVYQPETRVSEQRINKSEKYYYDPTTKINQIPMLFDRNTANIIMDSSFTPQYIKISSNFRFREVAEHSHSFIELNYLYSGECLNVVNGIEYKMSVGDILIMDTNSTHRLGWTDENDILINMLILPQYAESAFMEMLTGDSILSSFLVNSINPHSDEPNHIYLKAGEKPAVHSALINLLREYFDSTAVGANILINCYVREVFTLLMRECVENPQNVFTAYNPNSIVSQIIGYIKDHCITCTRESTAKHFGYSPSHLSQMLTKKTDKCFVHIRNEFRLNNIEQRLKTTALPVKVIAEEFGFNNATHFYKLYKEYFGKNPRE